MTRSGSLQYTAGGQKPPARITPSLYFLLPAPCGNALFRALWAQKSLLLSRQTGHCLPPALLSSAVQAAQFLRRLFYVPFLIMAKKAAVRQETAKQLFNAIKKKPTMPLMDAVGFCSYCKLFLFLKGIGQWLFRLVSGAQRRFCCGPFPCRRVVQMNTPGVVKGLNGHHRQRY